MTGAVEITLKDVYDAQQATGAQVTAVQTQMALLTATVGERLDHGQKTFDDHEARIRAREQMSVVPVQDFEKLEDRVSKQESLTAKIIGVGLTLMAMTGVAAVLVEHAIH